MMIYKWLSITITIVVTITILREPSQVHTRGLCLSYFSRAKAMAPFTSQCYPWSVHGIPNQQQACLVQSQSGARLAWNFMPVYLPNGTLEISRYSNPALGRSARFGSAWSGGEVELITLINSGMEATQLLRRPLAPPGPVPMVVATRGTHSVCPRPYLQASQTYPMNRV